MKTSIARPLSRNHIAAALESLTTQEQLAVAEGLALYAKALRRFEHRQQFTIRPIKKTDNKAVSRIIRSVMTEYGATAKGFAIHDAEVDRMYETYRKPRSKFFVIEHKGKVVGGAGIAPLKGKEKTTCELQKMYFLPKARGAGLGAEILRLLLAEARKLGFKSCYLETTASMEEAQRLYTKMGFKQRRGPLGCTGHHACERWYEAALNRKNG